MPIERERIDVAVRRWIDSLSPKRPSASALKAKRIATDALLRAAAGEGTTYLRDLRRYHFDATMADLANGLGAKELERRRVLTSATPGRASRRKIETFPVGGPRSGRSPATLVADQRHLRQFVEYCQANSWIAQSFRPFPPGSERGSDAQSNEDAPDKRRIVSYNEWPALLDAAEKIHPRTRVLVAMGLYWGRRVSEAAMIQWGHINSTDETVNRSGLALSYRSVVTGPGQAVIRNVKRRRTIVIPIGAPMQAELNRWQDWLEKMDYGPAQMNWFVVPPRMSVRDVHTTGGSIWAGHEWPVVLDRQPITIALIKDVQRALTTIGWQDIKGEGMHTLRRSVAAHLESIGEIASAQALLDHKHRSTTELYTLNRAGESDLAALMRRANPYER